ncbi:hypothetical protein GDO81_004645 [Engystomops pustulosus]|uniref:Uncharacterized protein n=1 Tax=Engystomops pustulosus TaxID=76066 RepID=A0AAV7CHI7_ENGPU|nr:hypothetical protein GDO81_004645 [Engystomops pustulosus]
MCVLLYLIQTYRILLTIYKLLARLQHLNKIQVHLSWFLIKKEQKSVIGSVIQSVLGSVIQSGGLVLA